MAKTKWNLTYGTPCILTYIYIYYYLLWFVICSTWAQDTQDWGSLHAKCETLCILNTLEYRIIIIIIIIIILSISMLSMELWTLHDTGTGESDAPCKIFVHLREKWVVNLWLVSPWPMGGGKLRGGGSGGAGDGSGGTAADWISDWTHWWRMLG